MMFVSDYAARATIELYKIYNQEITITGSLAVLHSYERAAELFAAGVLDPRVFLTDHYPLADYAAALDGSAAGRGLKTQGLGCANRPKRGQRGRRPVGSSGRRRGRPARFRRFCDGICESC